MELTTAEIAKRTKMGIGLANQYLSRAEFYKYKVARGVFDLEQYHLNRLIYLKNCRTYKNRWTSED